MCDSYPLEPEVKGVDLSVLKVSLFEARMPLLSSRHQRITEQSRLKRSLKVSSVTLLPKPGQIQR